MILPADVTLYEFAKSETLFRALNPKSESWWAWDILFKSFSHLPLDKKEQRFYGKVTGGLAYDARERTPGIIVIVTGRKSGKSTKGAQIGLHRALQFDPDQIDPPMTPGEIAQTLIIAPTTKQSKTTIKFCDGQLNSLVDNTGIDHPVIDRKFSKDENSLELSNRCVISTLAVTESSGRSPSAYTVIMEEAAHFRKQGKLSDTHVFKACRPGMLRFGLKSLCVIITSPDTKQGLVWLLFNKFFGRKNRIALIINAPTRDFNPTADEEFLEQEEELFAGEDMEGDLEFDENYFQREYESKFTDASKQAFPSKAVEACVVKKRKQLPPSLDHDYFAFADPASLTQGVTDLNDEFAVGVAHIEERKYKEVCVVDGIRAWSPDPYSKNFATQDEAIKEAVEWFSGYGIEQITGDEWSGKGTADKFVEKGLEFEFSELSKSDMYREFLPAINNQDVELLDDPRANQQLTGLELRRITGGKFKIDHAPRRKDDRCNVYAGLSYLGSRQIAARANSLFLRSLKKIAKAEPHDRAEAKHVYCAGLFWPKDVGAIVLSVIDVCCRQLGYQLRLKLKHGLYDDHVEQISEVVRRFRIGSILAEKKRIGESLFEQLQRDRLPVRPFDPPSPNFSIEALITAADKGEIKVIPDRYLLRELRVFITETLPSGFVRYKSVGYQGGCVFALALAWQGAAKHASVSDIKIGGPRGASTQYGSVRSAAEEFGGMI